MRALLILLLGLLAWAGVVAYRLDAARQRVKRVTLTTLSQASRARSLAECPPEFHRRLRAAMAVDETEDVA
jgi:hypothetical protein